MENRCQADTRRLRKIISDQRRAKKESATFGLFLRTDTLSEDKNYTNQKNNDSSYWTSSSKTVQDSRRKRAAEQNEAMGVWSDSKVTLSWIKENREWKRFVANSGEEIINTMPRETWKHVQGKLNPADLISRGWTKMVERTTMAARARGNLVKRRKISNTERSTRGGKEPLFQSRSL